MLAVAALFVSCSDDDSSNTVDPVVKTIGKLDYTPGTKLDVSGWAWKDATLTSTYTAGTTEELDDVTTDKTVDGVVYLGKTIHVQDGATLTFEAGSEVIAKKGGADINLVVDMGAKIVVKGTATEPVVFSSENGESGDWGGLTILGKGISTGGLNVEFEVGAFPYGGTDNADNSGSIEYLVVRGTGAQIDSESQTNGISFCAVGSETVVNHIAVIDGDDDGVEFYGGAVSASEVHLEDNSDDSVDWTEGWSGGITNLNIVHNNTGFSTAFEGDKENNNPTFTNVTAVSTVGGTALQFKKASGATITNLYLEGYENEIEFKDADLFVISNVKINGSVAVIK